MIEHYVYDGAAFFTISWTGDRYKLVDSRNNLVPELHHNVLECHHNGGIPHSISDIPTKARAWHSKIEHYWFDNGLLHRWHGPAVRTFSMEGEPTGSEDWYFNGKIQSIKEINKTIDQLGLSREWQTWSEDEKIMFRLAV